jgi:protein-S-isoprenylcysteine O-methyltransferase Ste14
MTRRRIAHSLISLAAFTLIWFALAGRVTWWQGWAVLLVFTGYVSVLAGRLSRSNPDLVRERMAPADKAEPWDRTLMQVYTLLLLAFLVLVALDSGRFRWSAVSPGVQAIGWLLLVAAGAIIWHVMMTNAFLSSYARLQDERNQTVVQEGAYAWIRHPMYLGVILALLGMPLALGSWWGLIPAFLIVALFLYRTYREDLMLIGGLHGYAEYASRVRYRLLPGIW